MPTLNNELKLAGGNLSALKIFAAISLGAVLFAGNMPTNAQVEIGIGVEPGCPYGYYDYAPYNCSPYGYYGPDWFSDGIFVGAGPWFRGHRGFYGHVDNRYDPRRGYGGPLPARGDKAFNHFQANEARDGQGHVGDAGHSGGEEHSAGSQGGFRGGGGGESRGGGGGGGGGHR